MEINKKLVHTTSPEGPIYQSPVIRSKSGPMPALTHLCSYASSHTEASTCHVIEPGGNPGELRQEASEAPGRTAKGNV